VFKDKERKAQYLYTHSLPRWTSEHESFKSDVNHER